MKKTLRRLKGKKAVYAGLFVASCLCSFTFFWNKTAEVKLYVDGRPKIVKTKAKTVGEFLEDEHIQIGQHDLLWPPREAKIRDGMGISVQKAVPVTIQIGERSARMIWTRAATVQDVLRELGIKVNPEDVVYPGLRHPVVPNQKIQYIDVSYQYTTEIREIKYKTVQKADTSLAKGEEHLVQKGKPGKEAVTYKKTLYNGKVVDLEKESSRVLEQPKHEVVAIGTLQPVSVGGYSFVPRKVLKNVKLTAYGPGSEHTGKTRDHPEYAITRSGVRAKEGRTVAVDPDLIPLGWWIYIEGLGLFRAEDTGSAVKGKKVDIYYEDDGKAERFGLKTGYTVYVIGPKKPGGE